MERLALTNGAKASALLLDCHPWEFRFYKKCCTCYQMHVKRKLAGSSTWYPLAGTRYMVPSTCNEMLGGHPCTLPICTRPLDLCADVYLDDYSAKTSNGVTWLVSTQTMFSDTASRDPFRYHVLS